LRLASWYEGQGELYTLAEGGASWVSRDGGHTVDSVADVEVGVRFGRLACTKAVDAGIRVRGDFADGFSVPAFALVMRIVLGSTPASVGGTGSTCEREPPRIAAEPAAPPPSSPPTPLAPPVPTPPAPVVVAPPAPVVV